MIDIKAAYSGYKCVKFAETSSTRFVFTKKAVNNGTQGDIKQQNAIIYYFA